MVALGDDWKTLDLDSVEIGSTIDDFLEEISTSNTITYFHNLKFDGRFILDWLLRHGYTYLPGGHGVVAGTFSTLISDLGSFYTITVRWLNGYTTEFRDSYKKLTMGVAEIAETFEMEFQKGELDYDLPRPVGWRITADEAFYLRRDVWIVARAIGQQLANGLDRLTVGADALSEFKRLLGRDHFDRLFPTLSLSMDAEIRRAYRGGFTYADPRYSGRLTGGGAVYDVNSLYPYVMRDRRIPFGEPEFVPGFVEPTRTRPLTIFSVTFTARLKPGHIPCIQIKGTSMFSPTEYLERVKEPTALTVTNIDWALICDHYDVAVLEWNGGWRFHAAHGIFDTYIDKWTRIKQNSTGGMRALAKLQLNSLYGKFATNPNVTGRFPLLGEKNTVELRTGEHEERNPVYTAAGVFITSYARDITIRAAQDNYSVFAYADTDSLHLLSENTPESITVHRSELGAWKHEYDFDAAYYIRPKAYLEREAGTGVYHNAVAGIPKHISAHLTFDDLVPGTEITVDHDTVVRSQIDPRNGVLVHGKLTPRAVPGGVVLMDTPYELKL